MEIIQDVLLDNINQLIHQDLNFIVGEIFYFLDFPAWCTMKLGPKIGIRL